MELGLDKDLEIYNLDKINITNDIIATWASLDVSDKYKQEFSSSQIVASMLGYDKSKIVGIYENLPIKSKKEIDILGSDIEKLINNKNIHIRDVYNKLEEEILNGRLENKKEVIEKYIINNYS